MIAIACATGMAACGDAPQRSAAVSVEQRAIDSLLAAGDSVYTANPDSAGGLWTIAFNRAAAQRDSVRMALALTGRAQAAYQLGRYDSARTWGERALAAKRRLTLNEHLFRSLNALGLLAWKQDRSTDAARLFAEAGAAARTTNNTAGLAKARMNEGLVLHEQARFTEAREAFTEAQRQFETLGDTTNLARTLNNRAALELAIGAPLLAVEWLASSRDLARRTADSTLEVNARGQLAVAYAALGEPQRAFVMIDSAIALARAMGSRQEAAENLRVLADLFLDAGDARHARDSYRAAEQLQDSLGQPVERGNLRRQQARALYLEGNVGAAERLAAQAAQLHDSVGALAAAFDDGLLLLELAAHRRNGIAVNARRQRLGTLATLLDTPIARARYALASASVHARSAHWSAVLSTLDSTELLDVLIGPDERAEWHLLRAQAFAGTGATVRAVQEARRAVALVEQVRARHSSGELRARYTETRARVFAELTVALLRQGNISDAFTVADAARGRALVELLGEARAGSDSGARTGGADRERALLLRRIDALVQRLRLQEIAPRQDRSASLLASSSELRDSLRLLRGSYEALHARTPSVSASTVSSPSLSHVQQVLEAQETLIEYFATPAELIVFVVTSDSARTIRQPLRSDSLALRISLARALMEPQHGASAADALLAALHRDLLAPALEAAQRLPGNDRRAGGRLVVVPHGLLSALPFAALRDGRTGRFAAQDWSVLQVPSAATLVALRTARAERAATTLVAFAPLTDRLPATRTEVRTVGGRRGSVVYEDREATESRLRESVRKADIVHVASHATMNGHNPLFSRLDLQPTAEHDGRLEVHEILTLDVRSPLVFLSGCETAVGNVRTMRFETRDEFTSLAHAWLIAGARTVIATLWRIDDSAAATFASHFYEVLRTQPAPEALAAAQRAMIARPEHRRPYLWAAYQAVGTP